MGNFNKFGKIMLPAWHITRIIPIIQCDLAYIEFTVNSINIFVIVNWMLKFSRKLNILHNLREGILIHISYVGYVTLTSCPQDVKDIYPTEVIWFVNWITIILNINIGIWKLNLTWIKYSLYCKYWIDCEFNSRKVASTNFR